MQRLHLHQLIATQVHPSHKSGLAAHARCILAGTALLVLSLASGAQAQVAVTLPNGGTQLQGPTLSYGSSGGGRSAGSSSGGGSGLSSGNGGLRRDGRERKFGIQWDRSIAELEPHRLCI